MKKIILSGLMVCTIFLNAGCNSSEIAAGIIGVAIGIGISSGDHDRHHRPPERYPGPHRPTRPPAPPRHCSGHRCYASAVTLPQMDAQLILFAERHQISLDVAQKIKTAFQNVSKDGLASFEQIGLNSAALRSISLRSLPKSEAYAAMARKLDISEAQARDIIKMAVADFDAQANDVESDYWQSCMGKGKWKTPQNSSCSKTNWTGCSPGTGATLCY